MYVNIFTYICIYIYIRWTLAEGRSPTRRALQLPPLVVKLIFKLPQIGTNGELTGDGVIYPEYTPFKP